MATKAPLTELRAVNQMLQSVGEAPVNSISEGTISEAAQALEILRETSLEIQERGWNFNSDYNYELSPDGSNNIQIPATALHVDPCDSSVDYVERERKLYDRGNRTFTISNSVKVDIVWYFDFEDLPATARRYIAMRAARKFQRTALGSAELEGFTAEDELRAFTRFRDMHDDAGDYNMLHYELGLQGLRREI